MTTTILRSMDEVKQALAKGQRVTAFFHMGSFIAGEATVKRVVDGVAIVNFGYNERENVGVKFDQAKQWVTYDAVQAITSQSQFDAALANGRPVQCKIDLPKPGSERTVESYQVLFVGGSQDGTTWAFRDLRNAIQVPVTRELSLSLRYDPDGPSFEKENYHLRNIAGAFVYSFESMTTEEVMAKLIEGYKPKALLFRQSDRH
jgi:hypothetical protein